MHDLFVYTSDWTDSVSKIYSSLIRWSLWYEDTVDSIFRFTVIFSARTYIWESSELITETFYNACQFESIIEIITNTDRSGQL